MVQKLGFGYVEAHEVACQLEHSTPNKVANLLDEFLEFPSVNPEGEPIPNVKGVLLTCSLLPLISLAVGQSCHVIRCEANQPECDYLTQHGVKPGASLSVLALATSSLLVQINEKQITLPRILAESIIVEPEDFEE